MGTSRFGIARLERADHKTLATTTTDALADLHVWSLAVQREMTAFEHEQLRPPQPGRGEQLEHEPMRLVDTLDHQLHRLDRLAVIALDAREGLGPVLIIIHPRPVRQRHVGRRVVTDQALTTSGRQARLERPERVAHRLV
jgi:hypothetical protein